MSVDSEVVVHLKEVEVGQRLSKSIEKRCQALSEEFHEVRRFEISIAPDGNAGVEVRGRATGKSTDSTWETGTTMGRTNKSNTNATRSASKPGRTRVLL